MRMISSLRLGACLAALAACPVPAAAGSASATMTGQPPAVTVTAAVQDDVVERTTVSGTLAARDEILVGPQIDGYAIEEILAEEGDHVQQGQVLARLARDTLETAVAQATAQVARAHAAELQARAQIDQAEANAVQAVAALARSTKLEATGVASRETLEQRQATARVTASQADIARAALASASADLAVADSQLAEARIKLAHADVLAPRSGVVTRRTARVGADASMAAEPLFRIAAAGEIELEGNVPEAVLSRLAVGQDAELALPGQIAPRPGRVRLVSPEVAAVTRLGRVRVAFVGGPPPAIGGFAKARIVLARASGVLVPLSAVLSRPEGTEVQVVRNGIVETRQVHVGLRDGHSAQILDGVAAGEDVVSVSGTFVRDGDQVTPVRAAGQR